MPIRHSLSWANSCSISSHLQIIFHYLMLRNRCRTFVASSGNISSQTVMRRLTSSHKWSWKFSLRTALVDYLLRSQKSKDKWTTTTRCRRNTKWVLFKSKRSTIWTKSYLSCKQRMMSRLKRRVKTGFSCMSCWKKFRVLLMNQLSKKPTHRLWPQSDSAFVRTWKNSQSFLWKLWWIVMSTQEDWERAKMRI